MTHTWHGVTPALQVLCWRSVCVLYTLLVCVLLPEFAHSAKPRCGVELIADLQLVCGDRGFYRGHPGAVRNASPRRRGKGIVEQCCIKGCDLQHLEHYCAKPKRERRHTGHTPSTTHTEDQFWKMFLRRYEKNQFENKPEKYLEKLQERMLYHRKFGDVSLPCVTRRKIPKFSQHLKHQRKRHN
ncbi:insulin-like growth factor 3 isoform X2 [Neoarius graeffei]|uniref:insulin-like growth factor 3 isoform X2 n=1 Tax=Neoarius graeffei TaxID=443677 RepID=UPI00298D42DD|nr:insulin-like growth factor 3 isoform X2 [Neoarius graeffei]